MAKQSGAAAKNVMSGRGETVDAQDLGSCPYGCGFKSCRPHSFLFYKFYFYKFYLYFINIIITVIAGSIVVPILFFIINFIDYFLSYKFIMIL